MDRNSRQSDYFQALREKAEELLKAKGIELSDEIQHDLSRLSHELEVQRVELELQNEELREANRQLERSRNEFADLYQFAPVAILNLNSKGIIERANHTAFRILPCNPDFLVGSSFAKFVAPKDQYKYFAYLKKLVDGKGAEPCELRILDRKENRTLYFQLSATAKFNEGKLDHWRLALINITERKQAQNELRQMTGRTIAAMEHDRRAVSKEIHDSIGGSLAAIKMMLETELNSPPPPPSASHLWRPS